MVSSHSQKTLNVHFQFLFLVAPQGGRGGTAFLSDVLDDGFRVSVDDLYFFMLQFFFCKKEGQISINNLQNQGVSKFSLTLIS